MNEKIQKITKGGEVIYPATISDAVFHPGVRSDITTILNEYNVSVLWPTGGADASNKYTIDLAIARLNSSLETEQKNKGTKIQFYDETNTLQEYIFSGDNFGDSSSWEKTGVSKFQEINDSIVFLSLDEYENLVEKDENKLYFIYEEE